MLARAVTLCAVALVCACASRGAETKPFAPLAAQRKKVEALRALVEAAEARHTALTRGAHPPVEACETIADPDAMRNVVAHAFRKRFGLELLAPFGFENPYVLVVLDDVATDMKIGSIFDLAESARKTPGALAAGFDREFLYRPDGWPGLDVHFGFEGKLNTNEIAIDGIRDALLDKKFHVVNGFNTNGWLAEGDVKLRVLDDDWEYFASYLCMPVMRAERLDEYAELAAILGQLRIDEDRMRQLNLKVERGLEPEDVAREFLDTLEPEPVAPPEHPITITVGGKHFAEQHLLRHIMAQWLDRFEGVTGIAAPAAGSTMECFWLLHDGKLDVYAEYTGTALYNILRRMDKDENVFTEEFALDVGNENDAALLTKRTAILDRAVAALADADPTAYLLAIADLEDNRMGLRLEAHDELMKRLRAKHVAQRWGGLFHEEARSELVALRAWLGAEVSAARSLGHAADCFALVESYVRQTWDHENAGDEFREITRLNALTQGWKDGVAAHLNALGNVRTHFANHAALLRILKRRHTDKKILRPIRLQLLEVDKQVAMMADRASHAGAELQTLAELADEQGLQLGLTRQRLAPSDTDPGDIIGVIGSAGPDGKSQAEQLGREAESLARQAGLFRELAGQRNRSANTIDVELRVLKEMRSRMGRAMDPEAHRLVPVVEALTDAVIETELAAPKLVDHLNHVAAMQDVLKTIKESDAEFKVREAREAGFRWVVAGLVFVIMVAAVVAIEVVFRRKALKALRRISILLVCIVGTFIIMIQFPTLQRVGITFLASAGVAGVVVGMAARSTLANAFGAVTLCFARPVRVGDTIMFGEDYGTIEEIGLLYTAFKTWDNRRVMIPNEVMANKELVNYSIRDERIWTKVPIHLDYTADLEKAQEICIEVARASTHRAGDDEPCVWFMGMGAESITLWVAAWAANPTEAWYLRSDIGTGALKRFKEAGISLPRRRYERLAEPRPAADMPDTTDKS